MLSMLLSYKIIFNRKENIIPIELIGIRQLEEEKYDYGGSYVPR